jgi:hypothetical protein
MASTPLAGFKGEADLQDSNGSGILGWPRATVSGVRTGTESPKSTGVQGVEVLKSSKDETVIGVNWDRETDANVNFNPKFSGVYDAPLTTPVER